MGRKDEQMEWFIRQIAEGTSGLNAAEVRDMSEQLDVPLLEEQYFCVVVKFMEPIENTKMYNPLALCRVCRQAGKSCRLSSYCYIGDFFSTVMIIPGGQENRVGLVEKLYQQISKNTGKGVRLGVGRSYANLEKLSYSRVEAFEALNDFGADGSISYIDDIYVSRSITTYKHGREKRHIIELFKKGEIARLKADVPQLVENVRAESPVRTGQPYPTSIRRTVVELLVEIMHIASDAGLDVDKLLDYEDPYSKILEMKDTPGILAWFFDVVEMLSDCISKQHSRSDNNMLVLAKKKIEEYLYDPELSLSLISGQLDITPTYFSAFFIREVGIGFNEYITSLRVEKAKQLLRETNLKIHSIADQCGFRSSSYFNVVFRKQTGMSPGEYRNTKNQNE